MSLAACTIASPNYLHFARTLAASYVAKHPEQRFFVLIVADLTDPAPFQVDPNFTPVMLGEIGLPDLRVEAMKYDLLELNTNIKPSFMKHLIETYG
ncbi:MAG: group 1 glycosyl transferase, partial [Pseudomonadota bacterium]|nr:group 1 glycosyl transferase [Pseudomonadota bacterium]